MKTYKARVCKTKCFLLAHSSYKQQALTPKTSSVYRPNLEVSIRSNLDKLTYAFMVIRRFLRFDDELI